MRIQRLVVLAGVLLSVCQGSAQTASDSVGSPSASSLIVLLDSPASAYTVPILLDHPQGDFSSCGKFSPTQVVLKLTVEKDGSAGDVEIANQPQEKCVGNSAMAAVRNYRFTPGQRKGKSVATHIGLAVQAGCPISMNGNGQPSSSKQIPPVLLKYVNPDFTAGNTPLGQTTKIEVSLVVEADGVVTNVRIIGAPSDEIGEAVSRAVVQDRFWPSMKDGRPVRADLSIQITVIR